MFQPVQLTDGLLGLSNGQVGNNGGTVAQKLLANGFNPAALRTNATLRIREWILYDTAVIDVARRHLVGVADLVARGMTYPVADAMGITRIEWEKIGTLTPAEVSMSGISITANDRQEYATDAVPLPIIHKDFQINARQLASSRRLGTPLDVTQAQLASRLVTEQIETMLFAGATVLGSNNTIQGYTTATKRVTGTVTQSWATATGTQMVTDLLAMIQSAKNNNMYGPYMIYVPSAVATNMGNDFKSNGDRTILERLLAIPNILGIKESKDLSLSNIILIQMTPDVIDMIDGMQPTTIEWESAGGMQVNFKVMAIMIPRIKSDYVGQSGIVHYS